MVRAPIHLELERGAVAALSAGDHRLAFQLADRRCRTPPRASPHCFVLRAESLRGMGCHADALIDLTTALELDPTDVSANRRMLKWGSAPARIEAAKALVAHDRDFTILRLCLETLREAGRTNFAAVTVYDGRIEGWAVWTGDAAITVSMSAGADARRTPVPADPFHPLASIGVAAASFEVERPKSRLPQQIEILLNSEVLQAQTAPPNAPRSISRPLRPPMSEPAGPGAVTIVVPVYADPAATGACLDSLFGQLPTPAIGRIILVDDAAPDPRIKALLKAASRQASVVVVENPKNLGFVGSINRALSMIETGDVILLNADTVVPPGFAARLAAAAHSAADIGTVTPLSNNGECTSFPVFNRAAPLPDMATLLRLDRAAALANRDVVVDMPNGIGFCLYIRRDCLDAVGPLAEVYHRGYFEDVDICLLARERGFRNVCAASVFVGHAGSRSFQRDKRALVLRNLKVLEQRYPDHDRETAAFEAADPLRPARAAIERIVPPTARAARLIVTGAGPVEAVARERARTLAANGEAVLTTSVGASNTYLRCAERVLLEVNRRAPAALRGFHDLFEPEDPPTRRELPCRGCAPRRRRPSAASQRHANPWRSCHPRRARQTPCPRGCPCCWPSRCSCSNRSAGRLWSSRSFGGVVLWNCPDAVVEEILKELSALPETQDATRPYAMIWMSMRGREAD
ncbi:MAG: glycosyltransferase, partial [Methylacidiphilales bacterium]|nr:glycosyltransferase [Candidatus Methylacidiphilales bacterium]